MNNRRFVRAAPFGQIELWAVLDAVVAAIDEFVTTAGVPLCALEDTTTHDLEQLLCLPLQLLPVALHWSCQPTAEDENIVFVPRELVENIVTICRLLSTADTWSLEAECPFTVWNDSGPGLLIHWLNHRICSRASIRSRRPHYLFLESDVDRDEATGRLVKRIYAMAFLDDADLTGDSFSL